MVYKYGPLTHNGKYGGGGSKKKNVFFIFMCPKWKMDPPREVNFSKISKFRAILLQGLIQLPSGLGNDHIHQLEIFFYK